MLGRKGNIRWGIIFKKVGEHKMGVALVIIIIIIIKKEELHGRRENSRSVLLEAGLPFYCVQNSR